MLKKLIGKIKDGTAAQILRELTWLFRYGRSYGWAVGWYILLGVVSTLMGLVSSILSKNMIDIVTGFRYGKIMWVAAIYLGMKVSQIILTAVTARISAKVQLRVNQKIRADVFNRVLTTQWEQISGYHSGDLLNRISRDTEIIAGGIMSWIPSLLVNLIQFVGAFAIILYYDHTLAMLALISAPVALITSAFFASRLREYSRKLRENGSEMTSFYGEALQNIQLIKSFGIADFYRKRLADMQQRQKDTVLAHNRFSVFSSAFLQFVCMVTGGVCFFWTVYRLWGQQITFGEMTLFLQLSGALSGAFTALIGLVPAAISAATSAGRIMELLELEPETFDRLEETERLLASGECSVVLQIEDMDFSYLPGNCVFRQVHLEADTGELVALVGPSGGGKTTMLRILLGLVEVEEGTVLLHSRDPEITLPVSPATRKLFSYVPQENTLFSGTVADNLRILNQTATEEELEEVLRVACADGFVSRLPQGIHTELGERGAGLSEGQIQRLSIARALLGNAPVLLLDEATSALDIATEQKILRNIVSFRKKRTCIVTTHRLSVLELCDRVYRINEEQVTCLEPEQIRQLLKEA